MKYLISGASSTLSQAIASELINRGHDVTLIGRSAQVSFELAEPASSLLKLFESHDFFLHLAHSFDNQIGPDLNQHAASRIIGLLESPLVKIQKCVFLSSDSASAHAKSDYGKSKYRTEQIFLSSKNAAVLRVGIIQDVSVSGPYSKLRRIVKLFKVLPFPLPNKAYFSVTNVKEITNNLTYICEMNITGGPYSNNSSLDRKSISRILKEDGVNPKIVITIPAWLTIVLCQAGKKIKLTRRLADSLNTTMAEPENVMEIPK